MEIKNNMRKTMFKTLKVACVLTTATGLAMLAARAADPQTTTGTPENQATTQPTTGDHAAKTFIKQAYRHNQTEIELAGVGMNKAQNADLKAFCQQMQQDHTQANKELDPLAQKYGVAEEQSKLREREVNKFEKESSGAEFDKKFATEMLKDHQRVIGQFERAASKLQETDVKQYAESMLPKLREHLQHAETIAKAVGVEQSTISSIMSKVPAVGGTSETQESGAGVGTSGKTDQGAGAKQLEPTTPPSQP